jgi:hypothetical protein
MANHLDQLEHELPAFRAIGVKGGAIGFLGQEALRFYSFAKTLRENFCLDDKASATERYITHTLTRSLLENYFWLIYIFDDESKADKRYGEYVNAFKKEYLKLYNEKIFPQKTQVEPADPAWATLPQSMDVKSMLDQLKNDYGDRLGYLYFVYRVASFDTHGRILENVFDSTFGKPCSFPVLNLEFGFDLVANQYLYTLKELRDRGAI